MDSSPICLYRFGPYAVNLASHLLLSEEIPVAIQEQPFQILIALLEHPGELVSREELRLRLWGKETFVDFDQSLNSAIRRLRVALKDSPKSPLYVETVPRVGFRFIAPVEIILPAAAAVPARHPDPPAARLMSFAEELTGWGVLTRFRARFVHALQSRRIGFGRGIEAFAASPAAPLALLIGCAAVALIPLAAHLPPRSLHAAQTAAQLPGQTSATSQATNLPETSAAPPPAAFALLAQQAMKAAPESSLVAGLTASQPVSRDAVVPPGLTTPAAVVRLNVTPGDSEGSNGALGRLQAPALRTYGIESSNQDPALIRSRYLLSRRNPAAYRRAETLLQQALSTDPHSAPLLAQYGQLNILLALEGKDSAMHEKLALDAAQRALNADPQSSTAHAVLATAQILTRWNWTSANEEFQHALALNPEDSLAHLWYAMFALLPQGRNEQAEQEVNLALRYDPLSLIAQTDLGWVYLSEGKVERARQQYRLVLELDPTFVPAHFRLNQLQAGLTRPAGPDNPGQQEGVSANHSLALKLPEANLLPARASQADPCQQAASALARPRERENFELLKIGVEHHCVTLLYLAQDPRLAPWQHDPRLTETLSAFHFPPR
jgi:DNA-binding winged helix-turn-helix (wHTH) protein/tetratricopeptide (TPR) repeat protein